MKVFKFDPETGKRGKLIEIKPLAQWANSSLHHSVKNKLYRPIACKVPPSTNSAHWTVHVDAGDRGSYLCDQWICFCLGKHYAGNHGVWEWVILPPKQLLVRL